MIGESSPARAVVSPPGSPTFSAGKAPQPVSFPFTPFVSAQFFFTHLYWRRSRCLAFRAEAARDKNDQADQQKQANPAAADDRTAKVKSAAAEQKK